MGIAGLSTAQDDILEVLGAAHQASDRPDSRAQGIPLEIYWGATASVCQILSPLFPNCGIPPTFAAPGAVLVLSNVRVGSIASFRVRSHLDRFTPMNGHVRPCRIVTAPSPLQHGRVRGRLAGWRLSREVPVASASV